MSQVTNGTFEYARVRKDDDYGINRSAKAQLSFTIDEKENYEEALTRIGATVVARVHAVIFPDRPAGAHTTEQPSVTKATLAAAAGAPTAEAPKTKRAPKPPTTTPAAPETDVTAVVEEPAPAAAKVVEVADPATVGDDDLLSGAPATVSDVELSSKVTHHAQATKNTAEIRKLIGKYGCVAPKTVKDIPQELRHKFLADLAAIPAIPAVA